MSRQLGAAGTALIQSFEKCRLEAYQDERNVWTIGWGHTGPDVYPGVVWTQEQADAQFAKDTCAAVAGVDHSLAPNTVNQNQFDAIVSLAYNIGVGAEAHSTLVRMVNAGDLAGAAEQFLLWNHAGGHVSAGLTARRRAERALFLTPA